ncbi:N-acetyltransferase [Bacillus salacetis]|uniref:N-acetyltransferase n=1 Tax=Bacillus salacetis TaxID=2315464 RepID=A0A3A1QTH0_9BACI|nr:GNAT family N-acetyltransferase [Bacillus salacetis]RIW30930.1 N-acetyltransferase [Bacillus salacetis]
MELYLERLRQQDAPELYAFECENREFFETMVPGRGEEYFQYDFFLERHRSLLEEQSQGLSFFFLIKNQSGDILGRVNLVDIDAGNGIGHLGYRVGEAYIGQGVAAMSLKLLMKDISKYHIRIIHAKTTADNIPSQKVLLRNGFLLKKIDDGTESGTEFLHYCWRDPSDQ